MGHAQLPPYPVKHYRGFMLPFTREFSFLAVCECKRVLIRFVVRVDIQLIVSCRSYPLGWHADELEHEGFDAACLLQSEGFCVQPAHKELVKVAYHSRQQQEYGVLCHELPCAQESLYQQTVQLRGGIEVIALARVRGVGRVGRSQF